MTVTETLTPYILSLLGVLMAVIGWLCKQSIQHGKDLVAVQTAVKFYLETVGKGAAMVLNSPNPTPKPMQELLRKYVENHLTDDERVELRDWLREITQDPHVDKAKFSAAIQMLGAMGAQKRLA